MALTELRRLYTNTKWRRAAHAFRRLNPVCSWPGCARRATVVDHIVPRSTARDATELQRLTWDRANWQSLCKPHHDEKTHREQGWGTHKVGADRRQPARLFGLYTQTFVVTKDYSKGSGDGH
jgi:5-methylcytosine-specific restriction enzyme A